MLATLGLSILGEQVLTVVWGPSYLTLPSVTQGLFQFSVFFLPWQYITGSIFSIILFALVYTMIMKTATGRAIRMVAFDMDLARALGINASRVAIITFSIGAAISGGAGVLLTAIYTLQVLTMGKCFDCHLRGCRIRAGEGRFSGTLIAGILYALIQNLTEFLLPELTTIVGLLLIVLVLSISLVALRWSPARKGLMRRQSPS